MLPGTLYGALDGHVQSKIIESLISGILAADEGRYKISKTSVRNAIWMPILASLLIAVTIVLEYALKEICSRQQENVMIKRWLTVLSLALVAGSLPVFATSRMKQQLQDFLAILDTIPAYSQGYLPDCTVSLDADGNMSRLRVDGQSPPSLEGMFDVIAALLLSAPTNQAGNRESSLPLEATKPNRCTFPFASQGVAPSESVARLYANDTSVFRRSPSTVQKLNTRMRENYMTALSTDQVASTQADPIPVDEYLNNNPNSTHKVFLFNAIPVSVLSRYPNVMQPDEVCARENIRAINQSFFKFKPCTLEQAKANPDWSEYFQSFDSTHWTRDVLNSYFLAEQANRDADLIFQNVPFRSLCRSWQSFFKSHSTVTKEELITERDRLDKEFSEMLKK
jgi:hypothetical protein